MTILSNIFSGGVGELVKSVGGVIDALHTSEEEKAEARLKLEQVISERLSAIERSVQARYEMVTKLIQAEMASGDNYTKRARPTLVYFGMLMIFVNYVLVPIIQTVTDSPVAAFDLPTEFWVAWGGTVGIWSAGRSMERLGQRNKVTQAITGSHEL